jgi:hypothetical protein
MTAAKSFERHKFEVVHGVGRHLQHVRMRPQKALDVSSERYRSTGFARAKLKCLMSCSGITL